MKINLSVFDNENLSQPELATEIEQALFERNIESAPMFVCDCSDTFFIHDDGAQYHVLQVMSREHLQRCGSFDHFEDALQQMLSVPVSDIEYSQVDVSVATLVNAPDSDYRCRAI